MDFIIVSGLSGAGKSQAADALEDMGFYCVDNLPASLIPSFAELCLGAAQGRYERVALVVDIRGRERFDELYLSLDRLTSAEIPYRILFLEASDAVLVLRYKETRRSHPLAAESEGLSDAVRREREHLLPLRARADYILDTSSLSSAQLRTTLTALYSSEAGGRMLIRIISFGFKYGIPNDSDLLFDVRFLPNPFYDPNLRPQTGLNPAVADYVASDGRAESFLSHLYQMMDFLIPQYTAEGKSSLVVSIGCTGGHHRSVAIAEALSAHMQDAGFRPVVVHRDIERNI